MSGLPADACNREGANRGLDLPTARPETHVGLQLPISTAPAPRRMPNDTRVAPTRYAAQSQEPAARSRSCLQELAVRCCDRLQRPFSELQATTGQNTTKSNASRTPKRPRPADHAEPNALCAHTAPSARARPQTHRPSRRPLLPPRAALERALLRGALVEAAALGAQAERLPLRLRDVHVRVLCEKVGRDHDGLHTRVRMDVSRTVPLHLVCRLVRMYTCEAVHTQIATCQISTQSRARAHAARTSTIA